MSFDYYTAHQQDALEALVQYRFLTAQQFARLGIAASPDAVRKNVLRPLAIRHKNPIDFQDVGRHMGASRIWYLTKKGAADIAEALEIPPDKVPYPIGGVQFGKQYYHRVAQIDFHLILKQWAEEIGAHVAVSDMDFVKVGAQRKEGQVASTKVFLKDGSFIIPDALFGFTLENQPFLYALEVHHGTSTQRATFKLQSYYKTLMEGAMSDKYNYKQDAYVLNVFEPERLPQDNRQGHDEAQRKAEKRAKNKMHYVCERLMADSYFSSFKPAFLFNTMKNVRADISKGWIHADKSPAFPFG